jgi:hypothetical protein
MRGGWPTCSLCLLLGSGVAWADEARIPVFQATTITQPGHYIVTRNISTLGTPVRIQAGNVTLDLDEHLLTNTGATGSVIDIADGVTDVAIRNGRLSGGGTGVSYTSVTSRIRLTIDRLFISDTTTIGIFVQDAESVRVTSCLIRHVGSYGIDVQGWSDVFAGTFDDNTVLEPGLSGIVLFDLRAGEVRRNIVSNPGVNDSGINLTGSLPAFGGTLVEGNTVSMTPGVGSSIGIFVATNHNLITKNVVKGATLRAFHVAGSENRLLRNIAGASLQGFGILGSRNLIENNLAEGNTGCGLAFLNTNSHAWGDNMLRGNVPEVCGGGGLNTNAGGNICNAGICP